MDLATRVAASVRRHPMIADAALAIAFAIAALISVKAILDESRAFDPSYPQPATAAVVVSMLALTLPLAWRRRFPCSVAGIVVCAFLYCRIVGEIPEASVTLLAGSLALYSVAVHGRPRVRTPVLVLCLGAILAEVVRELYFIPPGSDLQPLSQTFFLAYNVVVLSLPWALGAAIRSWREREQELADRAAELQREREENARQAVFAERVRIARELHDVVAHHVSVMGVQAGAARRVMDRQPDQAADALSSIEASSRAAVIELHRLLGFLRASNEEDDLAPQPGLAQLDDLIAQGEMAVDLVVEGNRRPLPPTLEVSAYRIVQEALTNTRKHSRGATATVRVCFGDATLEVEVIDDGTLHHRPAINDGGHGLIGMRERASLHGGHLRAGPRPEGGFVVHATFPLVEEEP